MKVVAVTLWLLLVALAWGFTSARTAVYSRDDYDLLSAPPLAHLQTPLVDVATLGYRGLYDDFITIWAMQFLADANLRNHSPQEVFEAVRQITRHHPRMEGLYMVSCFVLALDFNRPDLCEPIILDGLEAIPYSWRIPVTQGYMYAHQMNDPKNAAIYFGLAASRDNAPDFLKPLTGNLIKNHGLRVGELEATLLHLLDHKGGTRFDQFLMERREHR